ncbi:hypothetical protein [Lactobacillus taiwanensis]|uniref:hypothetical protein n=1 Tax=Lactobacillus taiwanensis TaxID=508451 RepID=UPI00321FAC66
MYINSFFSPESISAIADVLGVLVSIISAVVAIVYFYKYTKNIERINGKKLFIEEYRTQSDDINSVVREINSHEISNLLEKIDKHSSTLTNSEESVLKSLSIKASNTLELVDNQLISVDEWKNFFPDISGEDETKLNISTNLKVQQIEVRTFLQKIKDYVKATKTTILSQVNFDILDNDELDLEYISNESNKTQNLEKIDQEGTYNVLMVALRRKNGNKSWLQQSLGNWKISEKRMNEINYIIGINVETRNIVSLAKVNNPEVVDDGKSKRIRFKMDKSDAVEQPYDHEETLSLPEATYWNARNPVRYLELPSSKINHLKTQLNDSQKNRT